MRERRGSIIFLCHKVRETTSWREESCETFACSLCGREHPKLWIITRMPAYSLGAWTAYRINGRKELVDFSLPMELETLPRDAVAVPLNLASACWHDRTGYHTFGYPSEADTRAVFALLSGEEPTG